MVEHELWLTAILNKIFGGVITALLSAVGIHSADPGHPIPNYFAMELLVAALIIIGAMILRKRLSVESPDLFQQVMEVIVEFVRDMNEEIIGHGSVRYDAMIGTLGIFIIICNLLGLIPTFSTPTGHIEVTLGCAVAAFLYYNFQGSRQHGVMGYLKHLCGPDMGNVVIAICMGFLMFPIEIIGNVGRLLSLSVRLYANMFVGDILEGVFTRLIPIAVPSLFMALHIFVSALQAYIFMLLPAIYISMAVSEEH